MGDEVDYLLSYEMRPLRVCFDRGDFNTLTKVWQRMPCWDSCHFYSLVYMFLEKGDPSAIKTFFAHKSHYITHFYEGPVLKRILDEYPDLSNATKDPI